jgi:mRNA interferase MazF
MVVNRFDVHLVALDPARGHEIQKTRPCVVVSPDELNHNIGTVVIVPLTSGGQVYPTRVPVLFHGKKGTAAVDQIRTVDKSRLIRRIGTLRPPVALRILDTLQEMFAP